MLYSSGHLSNNWVREQSCYWRMNAAVSVVKSHACSEAAVHFLFHGTTFFPPLQHLYMSHECSSHGWGFCFPLTPPPCPIWPTRRPTSLQHCLDDSPPSSRFEAYFHLPTHESLHPYLGLQLWWDMSALYPTNIWTLQVMSEWLAWHQGVSIPLNSTTGILFCTRNHLSSLTGLNYWTYTTHFHGQSSDRAISVFSSWVTPAGGGGCGMEKSSGRGVSYMWACMEWYP